MSGMGKGNIMEENDIWKAVSSISYDTNIGKNAGRSDQMFWKHLQEGKENNDLDKIYEFIEAFERRKGLISDETVRKVYQKAYREDPGHLCRFLAKKDSIIDYWIFLSACCETNMLVDFAKMDVPYPHFYYECARILLKRINIDAKYKEGVVVAVKRISDKDLEAWEYWLRKNESNRYWQQLLFEVLKQASKAALKRFVQTIHLDMMLQKDEVNIMDQGFDILPDTSKKYIMENISKDIWEKWNLLIVEKKKKHKYLDGIWFTGYLSLILNSLIYSLDNKEEWKSFFLKCEKILEEDMYAWYENVTYMQSNFFYDITQIYYIILAGQEKQIIESDEAIIQGVRNIQLLIHKYEHYWKTHIEQKTDMENRLNIILNGGRYTKVEI